MASKRSRVRRALLQRAEAELSSDATALDYVAQWIEQGGTVQALAVSIAVEIGESCSRSFLSFLSCRLSRDARERLAMARRRRGLPWDLARSRS